jgi:hypothetical protein
VFLVVAKDGCTGCVLYFLCMVCSWLSPFDFCDLGSSARSIVARVIANNRFKMRTASSCVISVSLKS